MARIRTIKPEFWKNEILGEKGSDTQLLFIGLWNLCDRRGFLEYRPKRIKAELFPYREFDIEGILQTLLPDFVRFITFEGKQYIHVINFNKHQVINIKESESTIPAQYWHSASTVQAPCQHTIDTQGKEGKGKEGNGFSVSETKILDSEVIDVLRSVEETLLTEQQKQLRLKAIATELINSASWQESVAIALKKSPAEVKTMIADFIKILRADGEYFKPLKSTQIHFRNWAKRQNGIPVKSFEANQHIPVL